MSDLRTDILDAFENQKKLARDKPGVDPIPQLADDLSAAIANFVMAQKFQITKLKTKVEMEEIAVPRLLAPHLEMQLRADRHARPPPHGGCGGLRWESLPGLGREEVGVQVTQHLAPRDRLALLRRRKNAPTAAPTSYDRDTIGFANVSSHVQTREAPRVEARI